MMRCRKMPDKPPTRLTDFGNRTLITQVYNSSELIQ